MSRQQLMLILVATGGLAGCAFPLAYELHDDRWLRAALEGGPEKARDLMASRSATRRMVGCRALAIIAREGQRSGGNADAEAIAAELMDFYARERSGRVRDEIVSLCLRDAGRGNEAVAGFLKLRLAEGEFPAAAAYSLAALRMTGTFEELSAAYVKARTDHDFALGLELLGALWLHGDPRATDVMAAALAEMKLAASDEQKAIASWPPRIHRMTKASYMSALESRLRRLRAWHDVDTR